VGSRLTKNRSDLEQRGFTLIELLIVIAVLGIIAAVVVFALSGTNAQAAVAACKADAATVQTAVSAYEAQNSGNEPASPTSLTSGSPTYLKSWPNSSSYTITLVNGAVMVATSGNLTAVALGSAGACSGAGSTPTPTTTTTTTGGGSPTTTTTTTVAPTTTTTTSASNGVTVNAAPTIYGSTAVNYGGQNQISLNNPSAITALTITINVAQTPTVTYNTEFNNFWGQWGTQSTSTSGGYITYTYVLNAGQTMNAGYNGYFTAQYSGQGQPHDTSGDTWRVVSTSGGVTSTLNGTF
jgi:prepilin-type N-terminal cleavage/methylation domain-containing protein